MGVRASSPETRPPPGGPGDTERAATGATPPSGPPAANPAGSVSALAVLTASPAGSGQTRSFMSPLSSRRTDLGHVCRAAGSASTRCAAEAATAASSAAWAGEPAFVFLMEVEAAAAALAVSGTAWMRPAADPRDLFLHRESIPDSWRSNDGAMGLTRTGDFPSRSEPGTSRGMLSKRAVLKGEEQTAAECALRLGCMRHDLSMKAYAQR